MKISTKFPKTFALTN